MRPRKRNQRCPKSKKEREAEEAKINEDGSRNNFYISVAMTQIGRMTIQWEG
jgi:hypothetical protein